jgi:hypothetical protein
MLAQKNIIIITVHNDAVWWIGQDTADQRRQWFRLPLEHVLADASPVPQMPEWLQGRTKSLCIFPDHWFGNESFPFKSKKPSLIEPFLERKLPMAYPGQKDLLDFFNYRHIAKNGENQLSAIFLSEDRGYKLYRALQRLHHQPQCITSPALIWEGRLRHADDDFDRLGTLLIHHTGNECQLYFYHQGNSLFSRSVILGDAADGTDALVFEINQSLYMFSQKAKSELDRVYVVCNTPNRQVRLSEALGREVVNLSPVTDPQTEGGEIPGLEPFYELLQWFRVQRNADFFSVIQRQMKRTLQWLPVQMTGIVLGLLLLLGLAGENFFLRGLRNDENMERGVIETAMANHGQGAMLAAQAGALSQVLDAAARNLLIDAAYRLPDGFPAPVRLKELDLDLAGPPVLKLTAMVQAGDARELTALLTRVVSLVKETFENVQSFSLNDIDIRLDSPGREQTLNRYQIAFQLELT